MFVTLYQNDDQRNNQQGQTTGKLTLVLHKPRLYWDYAIEEETQGKSYHTFFKKIKTQ